MRVIESSRHAGWLRDNNLKGLALRELFRPEPATGMRVAVPPCMDDFAELIRLLGVDEDAIRSVQIVGAGDEAPRAAANRASVDESEVATVEAHRPIQDEWGLFDPDRCGIPAVFAKLDALQQDDRANQRPDVATVSARRRLRRV